MTGGGLTSVSKILLGEIVMSSFRWLSFVYSVSVLVVLRKLCLGKLWN